MSLLASLAMPLTGCCDNPLPNSLEQIMKAPQRKFAAIIAEDKDKMLLASILFQTAVTTVSPGQQKAYVIMKTVYDEPPKMVHGMPEHNYANHSMITCIYPKDFAQLSMYLTVLGGQPQKLPDILVLENLDAFIEASNVTEHLQQKTKILTLLRALPCQCIVSVQEDKYMMNAKLHLFADEVWTFHKYSISTVLPDKSRICIDFTTKLNYILLKTIRHEKTVQTTIPPRSPPVVPKKKKKLS